MLSNDASGISCGYKTSLRRCAPLVPRRIVMPSTSQATLRVKKPIPTGPTHEVRRLVGTFARGVAIGFPLFHATYGYGSHSMRRHRVIGKQATDDSAAELQWFHDAAEQKAIDAIRAKLAPMMEGCPEDMTHDLNIARFLRGHGNSVDEATSYLKKALEYRMQVIRNNPDIRNFRASIEDALAIDLDRLPFADEMLKIVPLRAASGESADGLPIIVLAPKLIDYSAVSGMLDSDQLTTCLQAHLEQRSIVLHNLSMKQNRMVKFVELRDFSGGSVLKILSKGMPVVQKLTQVLRLLQDFYPETIHQALIFNAPKAITSLTAIVFPLLNRRMKAKLQLFPVSNTFEEMSHRLSAAAIYSWMNGVHGDATLDSLALKRGSEQYVARWLCKGQTLSWVIAVAESTVDVASCFVSEDGYAGSITRVSVEAGLPHHGSILAETAGVVCLCARNPSWFDARSVSVSLEQS